MVEKADFRRTCRRYRQTLTAADHKELSTRILTRLEDLPEFQEARTVHTFWPIENTGEVDTRPLIQQMLANGRRVVLPVVDFTSQTDPVLEHRELDEDTELHVNQWGLTEPRNSRIVPVEELDLVIVPALGADRTGHRVGYGGGFYDRFLAQTSAPTVGLVYAACLTDRLTAEAHDIPVSIIVTETTVLRTNP